MISETEVMISAVSNTSTVLARFTLNRTQREMGNVLRRLATGFRINSGRDDPAGLIASERLSAEIKSMEAQSRSIARADAFLRGLPLAP